VSATPIRLKRPNHPVHAFLPGIGGRRLARRLSLTAAMCLGLLMATSAPALTLRPWDPGEFARAQAAGQPSALLFHATWCPICVVQRQHLEALAAEPGAPDVLLFVVDHDREPALRQRLKIRGQSTLLVFRGSEERAWATGVTDPARLRSLLQAAR